MQNFILPELRSANFRIADRTLVLDFKNAFKIAEKYHAEALCAEAISYDFTKSENWRRREDSNPRCPFRHTCFRNMRVQPLCHASESLRILSCCRFQLRQMRHCTLCVQLDRCIQVHCQISSARNYSGREGILRRLMKQVVSGWPRSGAPVARGKAPIRLGLEIGQYCQELPLHFGIAPPSVKMAPAVSRCCSVCSGKNKREPGSGSIFLSMYELANLCSTSFAITAE